MPHRYDRCDSAGLVPLEKVIDDCSVVDRLGISAEKHHIEQQRTDEGPEQCVRVL